METIYTGDEPMLTETLIERTIEENFVNVLCIKDISIDCFMPDDKLRLWQIVIEVRADFSWKSYFYSKKCIHHGYSITYLQYLRNKGVKKLRLDKLDED